MSLPGPLELTESRSKSLAGKTAVISGSSAGIGAAIALELSSRGANIVLNYPFSSFRPECDAVGAKLGSPWIAVEADLASLGGAKVLVSAAVERFHHIDILVNNAGIVSHGRTEDIDAATWDQTFALNARGVFLLTQAALPYLTPYQASTPKRSAGVADGARIICIGSGAGRQPQPNLITYAATKGALDMMIKVWSQELPPKYGCTVNGIAPGPVNTQTFRTSFSAQLEAVSAEFERLVPCEGAVAEEDDIAWAVAFLAEGRSKWINGEYINVNGGMITV